MMLWKKQQATARGLGPSAYAPIARLLSEISEDTMAKLRVKFDLAHFVATEKIAFSKYPALCKLEAHHGVNVFFSLMMDGTCDSGNIDDEMLLVVWCNTKASDEKVHTRMMYFILTRPKDVTGAGLFQCLEASLQVLGISAINAEECKKLVGVGTDGASSNVAAGGLKGFVENELPWIFWMWCLAHRLELSVKDALRALSLFKLTRCSSAYITYMKNRQKNVESWKMSLLS